MVQGAAQFFVTANFSNIFLTNVWFIVGLSSICLDIEIYGGSFGGGYSTQPTSGHPDLILPVLSLKVTRFQIEQYQSQQVGGVLNHINQ